MKTVITILISVSLLVAAEPTGAHFLKIGVGARPAAMAGAFVSIAEGAEAGYWNPAGLTRTENIQLTAMHLQWSGDIMYEFVAFARNFENLGTFGASIFYLNLGDIDARDEFGQPLPEFSAYDMCGMISFGRAINEQLNVGANVKVFQEKIGDDNALGYALDIGGLYLLDKLSFGLSFRNLGIKMKFVDEEFSPPIVAQAGASYRPLGSQLIVGLDGAYQIYDERGSVRFGAEYWIQEILAIRAGYQYKTKDNELGAINGLGAGLGIRHMQFGIDYGYEPSAELGDIHRISLKLNI